MENNLPVITVIIPVYKVEQYLERCVESVLKQTYSNLEIILVDDGSPDNCPSICDEYAKKDDRIKVIHKQNGGLSDARNVGIKNATGEYITLLDSDDYIHNEMIQILYDRLNADFSDLALCNYLCFDDNGNDYSYENSLPIQDEVLTATEAQHKLFGDFHWHYVIACAKLYKKELFDNFEYPIGRLHEDLFTTHLIFEKCNKISTIKKPLYYYYQNENSITHVYNIKRLDANDAYAERYQFFVNKGDYYCANYCLKFMVEKLEIAYNRLSKNEEALKIICLYKEKFDELYKDFLSYKCEIFEKDNLDLCYKDLGKYCRFNKRKKAKKKFVYNLKIFIYNLIHFRSKNEK